VIWQVPNELQASEVETSEVVIAALRALPLKQGQVMALMMDGYSAQEAAELLEMTPQAVRQTLVRARRRLREVWISET
jgi:RNA polymerase sigma factor (sigma-70 family)